MEHKPLLDECSSQLVTNIRVMLNAISLAFCLGAAGITTCFCSPDFIYSTAYSRLHRFTCNKFCSPHFYQSLMLFYFVYRTSGEERELEKPVKDSAFESK